MPSPTFLPDQEKHLGALLKGSTPESFAQFYDHYAPVLYGIIHRNTDSQEEAEDLLQQCFIEIWKQRLEFDPSKTRIYIWVMGVCQKQITFLPEQLFNINNHQNNE